METAGPVRLIPPVADQSNQTRVVEYSIDETNMEVSQIWDTSQAHEDRFFTQFQGDVDWLPERRNVLVTYGNINYVNGAHPPPVTHRHLVRIVEYTHDPVPEVVFDVSFFDFDNTTTTYKGYVCYRSERIPDLYAHSAQPVSSAVMDIENEHSHCFNSLRTRPTTMSFRPPLIYRTGRTSAALSTRGAAIFISGT